MGNGTSKTDRKLLIIIIIFVLLLVASIVLLALVSRKEYALRGADQAIRLSAQGGFECEYAEAQKLYAFADGVLKVTNERVAYLTISGNEVFSNSVNYKNPQCYINGTTAVVFDVDGYAFFVMNDEGVLYDKPTSNKIKSALLSDSGICAIITDSEEAYGEVLLYSPEGNVISEWTSYNSGYPVGCAFNADSTFFTVTTVNTTGAVYKPYVRIFSLDYTDSGIAVADYAIFTVDDVDIISTVLYCGSRLYTFSANKVYTIDNNVLAPIDRDFGSINRVNRVGNSVFIVYSDGVDQINKLNILGSGGNSVYDSPVGSEINAVAVNNDRYALSVDRRIFIFSKDGDVLSDISVDEDVLRIGFIGNNKLVVISTGGVHTVDY